MQSKEVRHTPLQVDRYGRPVDEESLRGVAATLLTQINEALEKMWRGYYAALAKWELDGDNTEDSIPQPPELYNYFMTMLTPMQSMVELRRDILPKIVLGNLPSNLDYDLDTIEKATRHFLQDEMPSFLLTYPCLLGTTEIVPILYPIGNNPALGGSFNYTYRLQLETSLKGHGLDVFIPLVMEYLEDYATYPQLDEDQENWSSKYFAQHPSEAFHNMDSRARGNLLRSSVAKITWDVFTEEVTSPHQVFQNGLLATIFAETFVPESKMALAQFATNLPEDLVVEERNDMENFIAWAGRVLELRELSRGDNGTGPFGGVGGLEQFVNEILEDWKGPEREATANNGVEGSEVLH